MHFSPFTSFFVALVALVTLVTSADPGKVEPDGDFKYLISKKEADKTCFLWYLEDIKGYYETTPKGATVPSARVNLDCETAAATAEAKIECPKETTKNIQVATALIKYTCNKTIPLTLNLTFNLYHGGYWKLDDSLNTSQVTVQDYTFNLDGNSINAGHGFSFSCNELNVRSKKVVDAKNEATTIVRLYFKRLQVQPYPEKSDKLVFHDSFDCSTWFTIPLWSSLAVSILLTIILAIGVYALLMIKTPDRFENPKGKSITVNTSE